LRSQKMSQSCWHRGEQRIVRVSGEVEADETFIDGKLRNMHKDVNARSRNQLVLTAVSRHNNGSP
jgi:hypothetical protein